MKGLNALIRLQKRQLDELRRAFSSLESQKNQLLSQIRKLEDELAGELAAASERPEMSHFFGDFAKRIRTRQDQIMQEVRKIERQMAELNDKIAECFGELKKYEIARDNILARQKAERERKENAEMDEIGLRQFLRKESE